MISHVYSGTERARQKAMKPLVKQNRVLQPHPDPLVSLLPAPRASLAGAASYSQQTGNRRVPKRGREIPELPETVPPAHLHFVRRFWNQVLT